MFLRVSGQFEARGESERPSIIDQAMNRRESTLAARSLANTTINTDRHCCDGWAEQPIIPQRRGGGSRSPARWSLARSVGLSVGRWASVLLASSDDTNRAGNYVTMPRPNLAATWPPMNTVWEYFITLLEICGGEGKFNSFHFSPPPLSTLETASISIRFFFYYRPLPPTVCDSMKKGGGEGGSRYRVSSWRILFFGARVTYPHDELRGEIMGEGAWCKFTLIEVHANDSATSVSRVCLRDHDSFYFSRVNNLFHVA